MLVWEKPGSGVLSLLIGIIFKYYHSKIKFVTPEQRQLSLDIEILAKRKEVYKNAPSKNPERWPGNIRNWDPILSVDLNPKAKQHLKKVA